MYKTLLFCTSQRIGYHYVGLLCCVFISQKVTATTFYINDTTTKGDIYTTAIGNDSNDGSSTSPKLTIWATYENAKDGDSIIIDTGSYADLSTSGVLSFIVTKKIKFIIAGNINNVFSKTPLPADQKVSPSEFYIANDKPIDRDAYLQRLQKSVINKSP